MRGRVETLLSGALNCGRTEQVTVRGCECGGGLVEGTPEELIKGLF